MNSTGKVLSLLALITLIITAPVYPGNYPFPQNFTYPYGIKATNANTTTLSTKYSQWKSTYVTSNGCPVNGLRVQRPSDGNDTVSEGIGYGMIIAVYFDDQTTFNGLWVYKSAHNDASGLMNWHIASDGSTAGANAATDGDEDIAFALIEADKQWGSGGTYDYLSLAQTEIGKIKAKETDSTNHYVKPGDAWDSYEFPAYYMPAYYDLFGEVTSDAAYWAAVKATCLSHIQSARNTSYGLVPTNINHDGTRNGNSYDYDSCRTPWRYANDYVWWGSSGSQGEINLLASFFSPKGAANVVDGYAVDTGNASGSNHNAAFVGPAGCSLMTSSTYQTSLNSFYSYVEALDVTSGYYQGCIQMITLLLMSGNLPDFRHMYTPTVTPTINLSATKTRTPTVTPTFTITPVPPPTHKLDLEIMLSSGSGSCAGQMNIKIKIINNDTVAIPINTLAVRYWLNTAKPLTVEKYDGRVYNASAVDQGVFSTVTGTQTAVSTVNYGGRVATCYVDMTFSTGPDIPAGGGYLYMDGIVRNTDWSSPLDASCNSYTQLPASYTSYTDDSHFNLREGTNLVCEYSNSTTQDPATGIDPSTGGNGCGPVPSATPSYTRTPAITNTFTPSPTYTRTYTPSFTPTFTSAITSTFTSTQTFTRTQTQSVTPTFTATPTWTRTATPSITSTWTNQPTSTFTATPTRTITATGTSSATQSYTPTATPSFTSTWTNQPTATSTATSTYTRTATPTSTMTWTSLPTSSYTATPTGTATMTRTGTVTQSYTPTSTPSFTSTWTNQPTGTSTATSSFTRTATPTFTATWTATAANTATSSLTRTYTMTSTPTLTVTITSSLTATPTPSQSPTYTATKTSTMTITATITPTPSRTPTYTLTVTDTPSSNTPTALPTSTDTFTQTPSYTVTQTVTPTQTSTATQSFTGTATRTSTPSYTWTASQTPSGSPTQTASRTFTMTNTATATSTHTPTLTETNSNTITPTYTETGSVTVTPTRTPTSTISIYSPTNTPTYTSTQTNTPLNTATNTYTTSPTSTQTPLPTSTNTQIITATFTPTDNITMTSTPANTLTVTPSATTQPPTATNTPLPSQTSTQTRLPSVTATPTYTKTLTPSATATFTLTVTRTRTPAPTATATPIPPTKTFTQTPLPTATSTPTRLPQSANLTVSNVLCYPMPYNPDKLVPMNIKFNVSKDCTAVKFRIFTTGFRLIRQKIYTGTYYTGDNAVQIAANEMKTLSSGVYYYVILASGSDKVEHAGKAGEVIILRDNK